MTLRQATEQAEAIRSLLEPLCERIEICGSIRRKQPEVSDIDIVCIPMRDPVKDMFGNQTHMEVWPEFISIVNQWTKIKGEPTGRYTQRIVSGVKVELSMGSPANFGCLQIIRTGNSDFSHMLIKRVLKCGLEQRDGHLYNSDGIMLPISDERQYFDVLNLPFVQPENRNADAFRNM